MNVSPWRQCAILHMDPELIRLILEDEKLVLLILDLKHEHERNWASPPTVAQILSQLQGVPHES